MISKRVFLVQALVGLACISLLCTKESFLKTRSRPLGDFSCAIPPQILPLNSTMSVDLRHCKTFRVVHGVQGREAEVAPNQTKYALTVVGFWKSGTSWLHALVADLLELTARSHGWHVQHYNTAVKPFINTWDFDLATQTISMSVRNKHRSQLAPMSPWLPAFSP